MKKTILLFAILFSGYFAKSQTIMGAASATVAASYTLSPSALPINGAGSIIVQVSSNFNGTTDSLRLYVGTKYGGSVIWKQEYASDDTTPMILVLTSANYSQPAEFKILKTVSEYYKLVYTKGNSTLGTITAVATITK